MMAVQDDADKALLVALWTLENAPPLPELPNLNCWYCGKEIETKPIFFKRLWACHSVGCITTARRVYGHVNFE